jgi:S1-C subfamily serine protease
MATEERDRAVPPAAGGPAPLRNRLPTTALGLAWLLFFMSIAAAFTGAVLYAYYEYRLGQTEDKVEAFEAEFEENLDGAVSRIDEARDQALGQVDAQLDDLERFAASGETLSGLLEAAQASVWFVQTLDEAGQPSVGSAFVVFSDDEQSFLLTSYTTIRAATASPGPDITVRKGDEQLGASLTSWDPANDLALLTLDKPSLPALEWAPTDPSVQVGDRVFVVSGLGAAGGSISQGFVAGVSAEGVQHDAPVGAAFQGGPLLNSSGEVIGVASRAYAPLGFSPEAVFFGVPVRNSCAQVIRCPSGDSQPG